VRVALGLAAVAFAGAVFAAGIARGDDRATATAILNDLAGDTVHKDATAAIVQRGRDALERATRMRASGDEAHARLADGLALEEAQTGQDLVRALDAERTADEARRAATDAGTVGDRERALLEEGIARTGRLRKELDELGKGADATGPKDKARRGADAGSGAPPARAPAKADGGSR
jgi:hypothetical protein